MKAFMFAAPGRESAHRADDQDALHGCRPMQGKAGFLVQEHETAAERQSQSTRASFTIDAGARTAITRARAHSAPSAERITLTMTFLSSTRSGRARSVSSSPSGVGRRKSTWSDAVTNRGVVSRPGVRPAAVIDAPAAVPMA